MKVVKLSDNEVRVALQLIDAAVKSLGLDAAEPAFVIGKKLRDAPDEAPDEGAESED